MDDKLTVQLEGQTYIWAEGEWYERECYQLAPREVAETLNRMVCNTPDPYRVQNVLRFVGRCLLNFFPSFFAMYGPFIVIWFDRNPEYTLKWLDAFWIPAWVGLLVLVNASTNPVVVLGRHPNRRRLQWLSNFGIFGLTVGINI